MHLGNRLRSDKMFLIMFPKFVGCCFINVSSMLSIRIYLAETMDVFEALLIMEERVISSSAGTDGFSGFEDVF